MKLYNARQGCVLEHQARWHLCDNLTWDELIRHDDLSAFLQSSVANLPTLESFNLNLDENLLAPIGSQEVWAAGVTYHRSRDARMEESESAGGGDFYDRVYPRRRPGLFFKATPHRVVGPGGKVPSAATPNGLCRNLNWRFSSVPGDIFSVIPSPMI